MSFPSHRRGFNTISIPTPSTNIKCLIYLLPTHKETYGCETETDTKKLKFLSRLTRVGEQDFWQIYFIVTQKDGIEAQSLGSSWGILSEDNDAGAPFIYLSLMRNITKNHYEYQVQSSTFEHVVCCCGVTIQVMDLVSLPQTHALKSSL